MSHHSYSFNGEGTIHKDPLSRILDELSSLKLWKEKLERKEKGKERVKINQEFEPPKEEKKQKQKQKPTIPRCQQGLTNPTKSKLDPETSCNLFPWKPSRKSKS